MDGFGYRPETDGNAIAIEGAKNICSLMAEYPHTLISASGLDVGLPEGQMGNSEVGHSNIGAGRIVNQELLRISEDIENGDFFKNPVLLAAFENCKAHDSALHLYGLVSPGGVHSHTDHLYALIRFAKSMGLTKVLIHCFTDGRDTPPDSAEGYVQELQNKLTKYGCGRIATVTGRYYAMDRDKNYDRVEKAYSAMVYGEGLRADDAVSAIRKSYEDGITDEFILPTVITDDEGCPIGTIKPNDSIIFFNFRPDRAREITRAFIDIDFDGFERRNGHFPVHYVCFTQYDEDFTDRAHVAFTPKIPPAVLGEYLSSLGKTQLRIAETEKYAHVTFFFNGGVEPPYPGEERVLVSSPGVKTYDLKPEMSAYEVTERAIECIDSGRFDFMVLNFANPDMVGHTGKLEAAIKAVEAVDICTMRVVSRILANGGECIITADHGNCESMIDKNGKPMTAHTLNPVPFIYVSERAKNCSIKPGGRLCDIAPTLLSLMNLPIPSEMTGVNLIEG